MVELVDRRARRLALAGKRAEFLNFTFRGEWRRADGLLFVLRSNRVGVKSFREQQGVHLLEKLLLPGVRVLLHLLGFGIHAGL